MSRATLSRKRCCSCITILAMRSYAGVVSASALAASSAVDQIIEYAVGQRKSNPDVAVDVLRSGLSYTSPQADPIGSARLHLAVAELESDRNRWGDAHAQASSSLRLVAASAASAAAAADLTFNAGFQATRALLVMGRDREAQSLAAECEAALRAAAAGSQPSAGALPRPTAHVRSLGLLALASQAHAGTATIGAAGGSVAAADALAAALGPDEPVAAVRGERSLADAAQALGLLRSLQGRKDDADAVLAAAAKAAEAEARAANAAASSSSSRWSWERHNYEVEADALTGRAQLLMAAREWGEAEEQLGAALKAVEAADGDRSPSLAPLLTLLGYTYSRSARVTFAEGLFREAAKLLRLDPARVEQRQKLQAEQPAAERQQPEQQPQVEALSLLLRVAAEAGVHASIVAVLAWRYAQLLWVLPNRGGEAARWEGCARQFWAASSGLSGQEMEMVLGGQGHLKGEGPEGSGVIFSTRFRRAWSCPPVQ